MGERGANWPDWRKEPAHTQRTKRASGWTKVGVWAILFVVFACVARYLGLL